jgi:hypothetical protein
MSILDDAIREHLELKRAHGADDAELKKLEDEAFGPPQGSEESDPFAEAPTEFLTAPDAPEGEAPAPADEGDGGRRAPNITDLQEPPAPLEPAESIAETGPSTEERHAIAEQPTEMFDVEGQFEDAATEADAPSDEQLLDAELAEPRLAPVDPIAGIEASSTVEPAAPEADAPADEELAEAADEFDEFFSEQRLSDELNQALEAPLPDEPGAPPTEEATAIYEVETPEPDSAEEELSPVEEDSGEYEVAADEHDEGDEQGAPPVAAASEPAHDDVLEDTPEFLADDPEDDNLWFEQKPPKDIDFGD